MNDIQIRTHDYGADASLSVDGRNSSSGGGSGGVCGMLVVWSLSFMLCLSAIQLLMNGSSASMPLRLPLPPPSSQVAFKTVVSQTNIFGLSPDASPSLPPYHAVVGEKGKLEQGLSRARAVIRKAALLSSLQNNSSQPVSLSVYRNFAAFQWSYMEMEKRFKVYVYEEGESPVFHDGPCKSIYSTEGRFIHEIDRPDARFRTSDPHSAHVFFMPFSVVLLVKFVYKMNSTFQEIPLPVFVSDYVRVISTKYPFWNQTQGANHFMLSCHDWAPRASGGNPFLYNTSIRVLCNANTSEGFNPIKDVTLPEMNLVSGEIPAKIRNPPPPNNPRPYLAFFAGGVHGVIRPKLLQHWKGRDPDLPVFEYLPEGLDYYDFMLGSKFCLCPSGHEVASPRVVEAIYSECIPVILSDYYVLPFSDVLNWEAFSVQVAVSDIPKLKEILMAVPNEKYVKMKESIKVVRKHFVFNKPAQKFDMFHMILHSVWLRRLNLRLG